MKKRRIKLLSLLLCFLLTLSFFSFFAFANTNTVSQKALLLQEGEYNIYAPEIDYAYSENRSILSDLLTDNTTSVTDYIYNELMNMSTEIDIYSYRVSTTEIASVYQNVINDHPDLFFVDGAYRYSYYSNGYVYKLLPQYVMTSQEKESAMILVENGTNEALSEINDSMSDIQKALVLHDYICDKAYYDLNSQYCYSLYGFFYDGHIVCASYSLTYSYLLSKVGIESKYIASTEMNHAWNAVKIDGNYYYTDVTWDDWRYTNSSGTTVGILNGMQHRCFMKSESVISAELGLYHYGFNDYATQLGVSCTDTKYDDYFWNNIATRIYVLNGDYYYLNTDYTTYKAYLVKRSSDDTVENICDTSLNIRTVSFTGSYSDGSTTHSVSIKDCMSRLVYLDNKFYFNDRYNIYSVDKSGNNYLIKSFGTSYVVGLGTDYKKNLKYQIYNDYTEVNMDKIDYYKTYMTLPNGNIYNNYPDINNDGYVNARDYRLIAFKMDMITK